MMNYNDEQYDDDEALMMQDPYRGPPNRNNFASEEDFQRA